MLANEVKDHTLLYMYLQECNSLSIFQHLDGTLAMEKRINIQMSLFWSISNVNSEGHKIPKKSLAGIIDIMSSLVFVFRNEYSCHDALLVNVGAAILRR